MSAFIPYLVIITTLIQIAGAASYIIDTLKGTTQPNRVTWIMWAIAPLIASFAGFSQGFSWSIVGVFMAGFLPLLVLIASFLNKNSYWKLKQSDYICGIFSVLALILWAITKEPVVAVVFAVISDALASLPTLVKAYHHPETETINLFITAAIVGAVSLIAVETWDLASIAFPAYLVIMDLAFILTIQRKKLFK